MDTTSDSAQKRDTQTNTTTHGIQADDQPLQDAQSQDDSQVFVGKSAGLGGKEQEISGLFSKESGIADQTKEIELPKEVRQAGVKTVPQSVNISKQLQDAGVKQSGTTQQTGDGSDVSLPLNQAKISQGMKMNVTHSWRWLAEWCARQIKKMQIVLKKT